jgi:ribosomal protein L11 methyltransferase
MAATWYQVTCDVPALLSETVADFLSELSGCGVCTENRDVDSFSPDDIPELATASITCYFTLPCQIEQHASTHHQRFLPPCPVIHLWYHPRFPAG